jgi:hypothetical protein
MKIYLHFEIGEPEFTLPLNVESGSETRTVSEVKDEFVRAYNARYPRNALDPDVFSLSISKNKPLPSNEGILSFIKPNTDVFLIARKRDAPVSAVSRIEQVTSTANAQVMASAKDVQSKQRPTPLPTAITSTATKKWTRPKPIELPIPRQVTQVSINFNDNSL